MIVRTISAPARMTSARAGWRPTIARRAVGVTRSIQLDLAIDLGPIEDGALDDVRVVDGERVLHGRDVGDGPAHRHEGVGRRAAVDAGQIAGDRRTSLVEDGRRDDAGQPEALRVLHGPDRDAELLVDVAAATEGELRAAAAGVEHGQAGIGRHEPGLHGQEGEPALLLAGELLDGQAGAGPDRREDGIAIGGGSQPRGADRGDPRGATVPGLVDHAPERLERPLERPPARRRR